MLRALVRFIPEPVKAVIRPYRSDLRKIYKWIIYPTRIVRIAPYVWRTEIREIIAFRKQRARYQAEYADPSASPLISIVIATYNRADLLMTRAVPSVLAQSYTNYEVLVIGDCCSDDTGARVAALNDPRFRFYNLPERPPYPPDKRHRWLISGYHALNTGRQMAQGKWLANLDDDDVWMPEHLEKLLRFAQNNHYEFASSQSVMQLDDGTLRIKGKSPALGMFEKTHCTYFSRTYLRVFQYEYHSWRGGRGLDKQILGKYQRAGVRAGFLSEPTATYMLNNQDVRAKYRTRMHPDQARSLHSRH